MPSWRPSRRRRPPGGSAAYSPASPGRGQVRGGGPAGLPIARGTCAAVQRFAVLPPRRRSEPAASRCDVRGLRTPVRSLVRRDPFAAGRRRVTPSRDTSSPAVHLLVERFPPPAPAFSLKRNVSLPAATFIFHDAIGGCNPLSSLTQTEISAAGTPRPEGGRPRRGQKKSRARRRGQFDREECGRSPCRARRTDPRGKRLTQGEASASPPRPALTPGPGAPPRGAPP